MKCITVEPASCPKPQQGEFRYDFGDTAGYTPLLTMYTLSHNFLPAGCATMEAVYCGASCSAMD